MKSTPFSAPTSGAERGRKKAPVSSKSGAQRWAEQRERELLTRGRTVVEAAQQKEEKKTAPTLKEWQQTYLDDHCRANRQKPATLVMKESVFRVHLVPHLGSKRLDDIPTADVQRLKARSRIAHRRP